MIDTYEDIEHLEEEDFITITGIVTKLYFEELMDGRESFHDVEWDIEEYDEDAPLLLEELKRAYQLIVDAAWQLHWNVGTIASSAHLSSKEWDEDIYAPAQAWRKRVQDILDASEEGCPWKESEEE